MVSAVNTKPANDETKAMALRFLATISASVIGGLLRLRALHVVAELGVADALGDAPQPTSAPADRTAAHPVALDRVLRLLAQYGVFENNQGVVGHTPLSRCCDKIIERSLTFQASVRLGPSYVVGCRNLAAVPPRRRLYCRDDERLLHVRGGVCRRRFFAAACTDLGG
jgi:hypothetical protein